MTNRRVVITGIGVVNALGLNSQDYIENLKNGVSGVTRIKSFDPSGFTCQVAAEAPEFSINKIVPKAQRKSSKLMNKDIQLAVAAADDAMRNAGLNTRANNPDGPVDIEPTRSGVNLGAGTICCDMTEFGTATHQAVDDNGQFSLAEWGTNGMTNLTPLWMLKYLPNMLSCHISIIYDLQGPSNSITTAEVSGMLSVGEAYLHIAHNRADLMVAGGGEAKVIAMGLIRYSLMQRVATRYNDKPSQACRPFDSDANGSVLGDGAGILVMEDMELAMKRQAPVLAEVAGFGASQNFYHQFIENEPDFAGTVCAIRKAMEAAGITPQDIDLVIPQGIGAPAYDRAEALALREVFGSFLNKPDILTTKWAIGVCGAASSAIDLATAAMAIQNGIVPGNVNTPDPVAEYGLNIPLKTHTRNIRYALVLSQTYGGQTAAMVLKKYSD